MNAASRQRRALPTLALLLLVGACVVQFTGAWVYPQSSPGVIQVLTKRFGVPFQYSVWALSIVCTGVYLLNRGATRLIDVLLPFAPFLAVGIVAAAFGIDPAASCRLLLLWLAAVASAAVIGQELDAQALARALTCAVLLLMALSALMALAAPQIGTERYGAATVWRGVFTSKNQLGWIAALTLVTIAGFAWGRLGGFGRVAGTLACALASACLLASDSKGALLAGIGALGARLVVGALARRVSAGLGIFIMLWTMLAAAIASVVLAKPLLALMQRDPTLTGRTDIWSLYLQSMLQTPWLGAGPGSYTGVSALTLPLASRLSAQGMIVTPHNSFLGAFGDGGVLGLLAFVGALIYVSVIAPSRRPNDGLIASASIALLMILHGLVETHEVFNAGFGWFLLVAMRSCGMRTPADTPQVPVRREAAAAALPVGS